MQYISQEYPSLILVMRIYGHLRHLKSILRFVKTQFYIVDVTETEEPLVSPSEPSSS